MNLTRRSVLLLQLPIPPLGPAPIRGNVPLAAAYLKLWARLRGLEACYDIDILEPALVNALGDEALVLTLGSRRPWLVGITCYVWNIERSLWLAREVKRRWPETKVVLGGPEITADNAWVLQTPDYDFAVIGEGEQTFCDLLLGLLDDEVPPIPIAGLYVPPARGPRFDPARRPAFRTPLPDLNKLGSPYLQGILDAADERMLLLETTRGCVFKCKFCYYPKSYDQQYFVGSDLIRACLRHAVDRGVQEVFLLDPTLNQRKDFADLLRLLAEGNPGRRFSYFGELRAEGITEATARLLAEANFTEVEVGLQSIDMDAQRLMERKNNLRAFERGIRALLAEGIRVKVDLIVGLPGDTVESVRRGLHYLHEGGLYTDLQVFNLAILPGTEFRHEAETLGLRYQPRPPYYVLETPTLGREDLYELMYDAQEITGQEFDPLPEPELKLVNRPGLCQVARVDLDQSGQPALPPLGERAQAFTLWLTGSDLAKRQVEMEQLIRQVLEEGPFTTLQVVLEPTLDSMAAVRRALLPPVLAALTAACQSRPTYLDHYYALQPGRPAGAKRLVVLLPLALRERFGLEWSEQIGAWGTLVWQGAGAGLELAEFECVRESNVTGADIV